MDNKMIEYKESFINKILRKIKTFFSKNSDLPSNTEIIVNKKESNFKKSIITNEMAKTDANIEIKRQRFEEGILKEEDLSLEEIKELTVYYKKLTQRLINTSQQ